MPVNPDLRRPSAPTRGHLGAREGSLGVPACPEPPQCWGVPPSCICSPPSLPSPVPPPACLPDFLLVAMGSGLPSRGGGTVLLVQERSYQLLAKGTSPTWILATFSFKFLLRLN